MKKLILFICAIYSTEADTSSCGRTTLTNTTGGVADLNEFPNMCTIYLKYDNRNVFAGGASLISDNMLLTLASGVKRFIDNDDSCSNNNLDHELFVVCGSVNLQSDSGAYQERRRVSRILLHPDYNFKTLIFDMAILILEKPFIFTDSIGPVCLPEPNQETEVSSKCVAAGHGKVFDGEDGFYNKELVHTSALPIWSEEECEEVLNKNHFSNFSITWRAHESFLCAGGDLEQDTCEGDGGGPLVCLSDEDNDDDSDEDDGDEDEDKDDDGDEDEEPEEYDPVFDLDLRQASVEQRRLVQVGIVAWGIGCGQEGVPGVYTRVSSGRCWIDQIMTCYQHQDDLGLRGAGSELVSVARFSQDDCGAWLRSESSDAAACGCKQTLVSASEEDLDLRNTELLGLRSVNV